NNEHLEVLATKLELRIFNHSYFVFHTSNFNFGVSTSLSLGGRAIRCNLFVSFLDFARNDKKDFRCYP
ncbi:MAG: hypothetical protein KJO51_03915, partial [Gramella sp.]|nr:hypothetical protein [Christiangramia sp.]